MVEFLLIVDVEEEESFHRAAELNWQEVGIFGKILANLELEVERLSDVDGHSGSDEWVGWEDELVHVVRDGVKLLGCFVFQAHGS